LKTKKFNNPYINEINSLEQVISSEEDLLKRRSSFVYPLVLDVGCGNGEVLVDSAVKDPGKYYLGFELQYKEVYRTALKIKKLALNNCRVARIAGEKIPELFSKGEIGEVNIYFPDPWPKAGQKKNRLIKKTFVDALASIMKQGSIIKVKTDNDDYFIQILRVFHAAAMEGKLELLHLTRDYHNSPFKDGEYITPFERIFLKHGALINYLCCRVK
jgi:tRNA (guanine-N7-)-methyltransferase